MRRAAPLLMMYRMTGASPPPQISASFARHRLALAVRAAARADRPTFRRASRRSAWRSASRSIRFRRSSARSSPRMSTSSAAIRRTRASTSSAKRSPEWLGRRYELRAPGRSGDRSAGAQRHARGTVSRRARRQALGDAARRPAGRADSQSVLCRLCGRRDRAPIASRSICRRPRATGFLPDLDALDDELLARTVAFYHRLAGQSAGRGRRPRLSRAACRAGAPLRLPDLLPTNAIARSTASSRRAGMLEAAGAGFRQRRRLPFAVEALEPAGPARRLRRRRPHVPRAPISNCATSPRRRCRRRCSTSPSPPITTRRTSRRTAGSIAQKFDLADQIIGDRYGYRRPAGGFFLWLDVSAQGGSEAAALRLWREAGLRVVPGRYLAREQADGSNPGADYIRVAMVQNNEITAEALHRLVAVLG